MSFKRRKITHTCITVTEIDLTDFRYTGESLQTGHCGITFPKAKASDVGDWLCHMGSLNRGLEITETIDVRVTGALAATEKELAVNLNEPATIYCRSSNGNRPLQYCRFLKPSHVGFNVDSSITDEK